jgi:hypothetical protein
MAPEFTAVGATDYRNLVLVDFSPPRPTAYKLTPIGKISEEVFKQSEHLILRYRGGCEAIDIWSRRRESW